MRLVGDILIFLHLSQILLHTALNLFCIFLCALQCKKKIAETGKEVGEGVCRQTVEIFSNRFVDNNDETADSIGRQNSFLYADTYTVGMKSPSNYIVRYRIGRFLVILFFDADRACLARALCL